jgi:membrane-bound lytic murein transglycosylase F
LRKEFNFIISLLLIFVSSCNKQPSVITPQQTSFLDLNEFRERGKIVALTDFNSTNYFLYKGEPMGFHYELLKSFSDYIGVNLEIITENDIARSFSMLNSGKADILAVDLTISKSRKKKIGFTDPISQTRQVLVQRKPNRWNMLLKDELEKQLIRDPLKLKGKTIYVQSGSSAVDCIKNLQDQIGDTIDMIQVPYETEDLINLVAKQEIDYAVCDENIAIVNSGYYPIIDVGTPVSFPQNLAWGIRKEKSENLALALNSWISAYKKSSAYTYLYAKYFRNDRSTKIIKSDYYSISTGKISPWDKMIKSFSDTIKWDWRLLASLIYQESRFNPTVTSWCGAYGLMQIMPNTGKNFGIDIMASPASNLMAGVLYIKYLQKFFDQRIPDENERLKFILGAYNAGAGNVVDAMKLAEKHGRNPLIWDENVAYFLEKKTEPFYYNDPVVQNGYCRGDESVNFVTEILQRYSEYKNIIPPSRNQPF